jgi:hypothetical protein
LNQIPNTKKTKKTEELALVACSEAGQHSQQASLLLVFYPLGDGVRTGLCPLTGVVLAHIYLHKTPKIIRLSYLHLKIVR